MKEIGILTIKKSLYDNEFRKLYPELKKEIDTWINNPDCKCNAALYNAILGDVNRLKKYFGEESVVTDPPLPEDPEQINNWKVINCHIDELEKHLLGLNHGPQFITIARWEDQITMIINSPIFN